MKILLTSDWFMPAVNGVVVSFMNLYHELKAAGHDVKILTLSSEDRSYVDGDFYFVRSFGLNVYEGVRATVAVNSHIIDLLIDWKPEIIHSQCEFFTYSLAYKIAKKCDVPMVHTYHTMYEHYTGYILPSEKIGKKMVGNVMKFRLKFADVVIAPTAKVKESLESYHIEEKIAVIPTGINLSKYDRQVSDKTKLEIRKKYNIPSESRVFLNLGRIAKEKNLDEIVDGFHEVIKLRKNCLLVIVGSGPYLDQLKKKVEDLKISDFVRFTGMVKPDECINYYQTSDVFLSASISETQGLTYIEALANSLPEIVRKDRAVEGVIESGYNGFIFTNTDEFVDYVVKMIDDDNLINEMSKNALESSKKFSTEIFGKNVYKLYEDTIKNYDPEKRKLYIVKLTEKIKKSGKKLIKDSRLIKK